MTQEERELLLKDLCGRLDNHSLLVKYGDEDYNILGIGFGRVMLVKPFMSAISGSPLIEEVKPYLRPISSMTEEEGKELEHLLCEIDFPGCVDTTYGCVTFAGDNDFIGTEIAEVYTDWLNKKMFDYRGLIPMGLALPTKERMYE